jgi:putative ABC transport system permease protein
VLDEESTKMLTPEGESVNSEGWPTLGFGIDTDPALSRFNPLNLFEGRWPASDDEVVIDVGTADERDYAVGDTVEISTLQPKRPFEIVGVAKYGDVESLGAIGFVVFTILAAQQLLGREGQFDAISVAAQEGISEDELVAAIEPALPGNAEVVSATAEAEEQADEVSEFTSIFRYFLLAFGAISLFVGAFVIFNTFSITVAQRTREFATLRTIGASRRQVLGSVILESLVIGLLASLVGLALGVLLAEGIEALFGSLGVDLPSADRVFATRTIVVSLAVGMGITLLAGLFRDPRDARAADRRGARAELPHPGSTATRRGSPGSSSRLGRRARARDVRRRPRDGRPAALDRRRRAAPLPRRRHAVVAPRAPARGGRRNARPPRGGAAGSSRAATGPNPAGLPRPRPR